jgi:hypothetical protein
VDDRREVKEEEKEEGRRSGRMWAYIVACDHSLGRGDDSVKRRNAIWLCIEGSSPVPVHHPPTPTNTHHAHNEANAAAMS